jgi:SNF2 family DNA or RNA helicase
VEIPLQAAPTASVYLITNGTLGPSRSAIPDLLSPFPTSDPMLHFSLLQTVGDANVHWMTNGILAPNDLLSLASFTTIPTLVQAVFSLPLQSVPEASVYWITNGLLDAGESLSLLSPILTLAPAFSPIVNLRELHETLVSDNLFERLRPIGINGAEYFNRERKQPFNAQRSKTSDQNGFNKAYSRMKTPNGISTHAIIALSLWDLIYPTLLPPLPVEFDPDIDVQRRLYPYQQVGVKFLVEHESALLADDMGTGKTVMTAVALRVLFQRGAARKALIVCPVGLLRVWQDHLGKWAPELSLTVVRGGREERKLDWKYAAHVYLAAYDTVAADFLSVVKRKTKIVCKACQRACVFGEKVHLDDEQRPKYQCPHCGTPIIEFPVEESLVSNDFLATFDAVILDEAQYIKNPNTSRSRAVKRPIPSYLWALTGTPVETKVEDLAGIFSFIKPKYMPYNVTRREAKRLMQPYFLRRLKKDVLQDLPPKIKQEHWLDLASEQRSEYERVLRGETRKLNELGQQVTKAHIFAVITALKRVCNFAAGTQSSPKSELLVDYVRTIKESGNKALVFTQWVDEYGVATLQSILEPYGVSVLKGGLSDAQREASIESFRKDPKISVLLATLKTGGVGLTLTEANYVFHFDHWWNPATMWQAEDRVHRRGQQKGVNVYSFLTQKTIEERINQKLIERGLLFEDVVNSLSENDIDEALSTDDWLEMLDLPPLKRTRAN